MATTEADATEAELRSLMVAGLAGDSAAHRALLERLSLRLRAYYKSRLGRIVRRLASFYCALVQRHHCALHLGRRVAWALSGVAHAEPTLTRKSRDGAPSSQLRQIEPDWYRARAMQEGAPPAHIVREGTRPQTGCRYRYSGGPKGLPFTC